MKTILLLLIIIFPFVFIYSFLGRLWLKFIEYLYDEYDINILYLLPLSSKDESIIVTFWIAIMPLHLALLLVRLPFTLSKQALEFIANIPSKCRKFKIKKLLKQNKKE